MATPSLDEVLDILHEIAPLELAADWDAITKTRTGDLVSVMSMVCPFSPIEKQALLEAADGADRAATMISLMEMDQAGDDEPTGPVN